MGQKKAKAETVEAVEAVEDPNAELIARIMREHEANRAEAAKRKKAD